MKITDKIIAKFGSDKLLHLCIAGWCVSISSQFGIWSMVIITILVFIMSVSKELWLDSKRDWYDLLAAVIGMAVAWIPQIFI